MHRKTQNCNSLSGFRRIRLLIGKFAFLILASFAAGTAWGGTRSSWLGNWRYSATDGTVWFGHETVVASVTEDSELASELILAYEDSTSERTFDFWLNFGIVGDSATNSVKLTSFTSTGGYLGWSSSSSDYRNLSFPQLETPPDGPYTIWYQAVYSNATYKGASPVPAANDLTVASEVYHITRGTGTALDDHPELGYVITGLGEVKNEIAWVFTGKAFAGGSCTWTAPADLRDVRFLVVGGGGGGGAGVYGPGGGGGGVVTGLVHSLSLGDEVGITVGSYGAGASSKSKAGTAGSNSSFSVNGTTYATAYGGGASGVSAKGGSGGSGSGGGAKSGTSYAGGSATKGTFNATYVTAEAFGNAGGSNSKGAYSSGGGGGATAAGGNSSGTTTSNSTGGKGGEGLASDITGTTLVYGSGGGGAGYKTRGYGGTGAGNGAYYNTNRIYPSSGIPNRGGGGGGGGADSEYYRRGGHGGSGVVILRYVCDPYVLATPVIASKQYTGEALTADIPASDGYTVVNNGGTDVGTYDVVITLNEGYRWFDETLESPLTLSFAITQAPNEWTSVPAISKSEWTDGLDVPDVLTAGVTRFGTVAATIAKDGGEATSFDGTLPTAAGSYVITYTAPVATANYTAPETASYTVSFTIYAADAIPDYTLTLGTLSVGIDRVLSVPWTLSCDVTTMKTADLFVRYALDGDTTTNTAQIATAQALGSSSGTGSIADLKPGATYWVEIYTVVDETAAEPTALQSVAVPGSATDFSASATFTPIPMEFIVKGSVTPGLGTTTVTVKWSLNNAASYDEMTTFTFALGDDGTFAQHIPHTALADVLTWEVSVANTVTTTTWGEQTFDAIAAVSDTTVCKDTGRTTYTWTGLGGDNLWTNVLNWAGTNTNAKSLECYGYPGLKFSSPWGVLYWDVVAFTNDAVVDMQGYTFGLRDFDSSDGDVVNILFDPNIDVTLRNGTLDVDGASAAFGASGTKVTFDSVRIIHTTTSVSFNLDVAAAGATVCFAGNSTAQWKYIATKANTKIVFRDGTTRSRYSGSTTSISTRTVEITNAVWNITNGHLARGIGNVTTFRDGDDRQAQITTGTGQYIDLCDTYDIKIPANGHADASIVAGYLNNDTTVGTFKLDVSDYGKKARVPLVRFSNTTASYKANNATRFAAQYTANGSGNLRLQAVADGKDVTEKRKARLEWDNATQTIYYAQDYTASTILILQ